MKTLKNISTAIALISTLTLFTGCANNAQTMAAIGGAIGAGIGQAIGHNTEGTLIGAGVGSSLGYMFGNETDKYAQQATLQAAQTGQSVTFQDNRGSSVTANPGRVYYNPRQRTNCRKVRKITRNGDTVIKDTTEEVCESSKSTNTY